ncbi:hypothetical protein TARUN_1022 [Trichoderma arundinaceum]|uniref:2EXR domain-containing protein n=1 Tax=Trichoderma arundinaceum TaxID=490622 RepID=A0A395NYK0_TRIAR|nr:hypothetical protein TARUN_1022 [Trichoderma arundinaceum]
MDDSSSDASIPSSPVDPGSDNDPFMQAQQMESIAYHALINEGGRPSHPLSLLQNIVTAPGKYRDILAFWQDQSDEWQVFNKQLSRWQMFRAHQRTSREPDRFPKYVEELNQRLERHNFALPPSFEKAPSGFSRHLDRQDKLATWIEYLNYEFTRRDEYDKWLETCQPGYDAALKQLLEARVLRPFEKVRTSTSDICRPSSIEVTRRKEERRKAEEAWENAKKQIQWRDALGEPQPRHQIEQEDRQLSETRERLRSINKRAYIIADFARKTHAYRFALDRSERHELLLHWALDQIPLIEEEIRENEQSVPAGGMQGNLQGYRPSAKPTFQRFQQLPPEIRHRIWLELIPRKGSVHFFDVLNHQRKRHLASSWSSEEFRVRATTARDSGYRPVYTLLATCRESRRVIQAYYARQWNCLTCPLTGRPIKPCDEPDFRTFDWIPPEDLIILCFPPIQVARLPPGNALTLKPGPTQPARQLGICVPTEIMSMNNFNPADEGEGDDDAAQISLIPEFIDRLHAPSRPDLARGVIRRGIWKLYLVVEGWSPNHLSMQVTAGIDTNRSVEAWSKHEIIWHSQAAKKDERKTLWKHVHGAEDDESASAADNKRQLFWLGSGRSALGSLRPEDLVQKPQARKLCEFLDTLAMECDMQPWHKGFEGVEALGWLEPADMDVLESHPWDLVDVIRKQSEHVIRSSGDATSS